MGKFDEILGNISINHKIRSLAIFTALIALIVSSIITIFGLNNNSRYQKSMDNFFQQFSLLRDISERYNMVHEMMVEYLLFWDDDNIIDDISARFDESFNVLESDVVQLEAVLPPSSQQNDAINKVYGYLYHLQNFRFSLPALAPDEVENFFIKLESEIIGPLNSNMSVAFGALVGNINKESEYNHSKYSQNVIQSYIAVAVLFVFAIIYMVLVIRNIRQPLDRLTIASKHFGDGDQFILTPIERKDEIGILNNTFVLAAQEVQRNHIELEKHNKILLDLNNKLEELSNTDKVTGIRNRRALDEFAAMVWAEHQRMNLPLTIIYMDIDRFKYYNDTFGHLKGDDCLRSVSECAKGHIRRSTDLLARAGGEEFVAVLANTSGEAAVELAENIRASVQAMKISNPKSEACPYVTVSVGVATRHPSQIGSVQELMELADSMCYTSKTTGRNKVTADIDPAHAPAHVPKAPDGYFMDAEPKTVLMPLERAPLLDAPGAQSGLLIVATDKRTGQLLQGVTFDVRRADGGGDPLQCVTFDVPQVGGQVGPGQPNSAGNSLIGSEYATDAQGRVLISNLPAGKYNVKELKPLGGYEPDNGVYTVTVPQGKPATLQLNSTPKAGLRILKIDALTKAPIAGVEFMAFDHAGEPMGRYNTDGNGIVNFAGALTAGRYMIKETKAAPGYYPDEAPKAAECESGKMNDIVWENQPQTAQIQITKRSGDDNEVTGMPKGTLLADAVFELYAYETGDLIDRFISDADGIAKTKALPFGKYTIKEVQAPQWYRLSSQTLDIKLDSPAQPIKIDCINYSSNTGVAIRNSGVHEAMPGDIIRYAVKELRNTSAVELTDFYWRDILPVSAVRLEKIATGTYNQNLGFSIMAITNKGNNITIASGLSTTQNNIVECGPDAIGLGGDEYVSSFALLLGTVGAGFTMVEQPQVFAKVLPNPPDRLEFANKCDVGGKNGKNWIVLGSSWPTTIYNPANAAANQ